MTQSPLTPFITEHGTMVLDGALATMLETRGFDLNNELWSARILADHPEAIRQLHLDYFWAGADCAITATYQATITGFSRQGFTEEEGVTLMRLAVDLAVDARNEYDAARPSSRSPRPLVAASIGPYGAFLANGSEYTGDYNLSTSELHAFHQDRWHLLANTRADLLACETIPSEIEAYVYLDLLRETPDTFAWLTFSCPDGRTISDGTPIETVVAHLETHQQVAAVGINCTAPQYLPELIKRIQTVSTKPIVVYPNSGEIYNPATKAWLGTRYPEAFGTAAREWRKCGAAIIGGCCRTTPEHTQALATRFKRVKH